jgi:hypothetical protein
VCAITLALKALRVSHGSQGKGLGAKSFLLTVEPYVVIGDMQVSHGCPRAPSFEKQAVLKSTVLKCIAGPIGSIKGSVAD